MIGMDFWLNIHVKFPIPLFGLSATAFQAMTFRFHIPVWKESNTLSTSEVKWPQRCCCCGTDNFALYIYREKVEMEQELHLIDPIVEHSWYQVETRIPICDDCLKHSGFDWETTGGGVAMAVFGAVGLFFLAEEPGLWTIGSLACLALGPLLTISGLLNRRFYKEACSGLHPFHYGYTRNTDPNDSARYNQFNWLESADYAEDFAALNPSAAQVEP